VNRGGESVEGRRRRQGPAVERGRGREAFAPDKSGGNGGGSGGGEKERGKSEALAGPISQLALPHFRQSGSLVLMGEVISITTEPNRQCYI
jgi:hypothetical protein